MVKSGINVLGKQWWGRSHFRIGSRTQPRPNKGFKLFTNNSIHKTVEYFRWWKRIRRGNLAFFRCSKFERREENLFLLTRSILAFYFF
uniref:Uncharacterized protein n=1 Tax=Theileria annulata TaxID=5874 RepID=A0A3B0MWD9_THEAN